MALDERDWATLGQPAVPAYAGEGQFDVVPVGTLVPARTTLHKRAFDLAVGSFLALVLTPLMLMLAFGSAVAYRAWPIFSHERLGHRGRIFTFMKIRSLPPETPAYIDKYELQQHRNNRWGSLLRKTHLDELPQLWLVVAGHMSLVGPRPEMPDLSATFDRTFVEERLTVPPGCTGLWQISPASAGLIGESPEYDLHYVQRWTVRLDLWIMFRTAKALFVKASHATLHDIPKWTGAHFHMPHRHH